MSAAAAACGCANDGLLRGQNFLLRDERDTSNKQRPHGITHLSGRGRKRERPAVLRVVLATVQRKRPAVSKDLKQRVCDAVIDRYHRRIQRSKRCTEHMVDQEPMESLLLDQAAKHNPPDQVGTLVERLAVWTAQDPRERHQSGPRHLLVAKYLHAELARLDVVRVNGWVVPCEQHKAQQVDHARAEEADCRVTRHFRLLTAHALPALPRRTG
mmetsp:Transcript_11162/g.31689  ORF Transcript_11162/g.31689 Transcript_11162/m.31689 type:complete len:213 (-) Transcript_11162:347-985(-)